MIDHIGISVSHYENSKAFYIAALSPISYALLLEVPAALTGRYDVAGFGISPNQIFGLVAATQTFNVSIDIPVSLAAPRFRKSACRFST